MDDDVTLYELLDSLSADDLIKDKVAYCTTCGFIPGDSTTCRCGECWHYTDINACAGTIYDAYDLIDNLSPVQVLRNIKKYRNDAKNTLSV